MTETLSPAEVHCYICEKKHESGVEVCAACWWDGGHPGFAKDLPTRHTEELSTLRTRAERAEQDARFAVEALLLHNKDALPMATRMVEMEQALSAAQSTIADLKAEVGRLRDFVGELADEPCSYGDGCPDFVGTRHGTCLHCQARAALGGAA